jgi:hypothetical protein
VGVWLEPWSVRHILSLYTTAGQQWSLGRGRVSFTVIKLLPWLLRFTLCVVCVCKGSYPFFFLIQMIRSSPASSREKKNGTVNMPREDTIMCLLNGSNQVQLHFLPAFIVKHRRMHEVSSLPFF